jgi:hypothetical protein
MTKGPLGRELILLDDNKKVLVLIGIDGEPIPRNIRLDTESLVETKLREKASEGNNDFIKEVNLTVGENVTEQQRRELGKAAIYTQQYEVQTSLEEIPQQIVNAIHNSTIESVENAGFSIAGVKTKVI